MFAFEGDAVLKPQLYPIQMFNSDRNRLKLEGGLRRLGNLITVGWIMSSAIVAGNSQAASSAVITQVYGTTAGAHTSAVGINDWLTVESDGLSLEQLAFATNFQSKIILFLNDASLAGLCTHVSINPSTGHAALRFHLQRTDATRADWAALLGRPRLFPPSPLLVHASVGFGDGWELPGSNDEANTINFIVIREGWFWTCMVFTVLLLLAIYLLARFTEALRDDGPPPPNKNLLRTYSLARCQMAFWFVLVVPMFMFLWLVTGALDTLTPSILALMGISSATAVFAHAQGKQNGATSQYTTPKTVGLISGFIDGALNDTEGHISLHHFQMFVWTSVMGCIYLVEVWRNLAMPEFSGTLLGLMGVSSGTYLGFMLGAQGSTSSSAPPPPPPPPPLLTPLTPPPPPPVNPQNPTPPANPVLLKNPG